jgi:hypothetical protein
MLERSCDPLDPLGVLVFLKREFCNRLRVLSPHEAAHDLVIASPLHAADFDVLEFVWSPHGSHLSPQGYFQASHPSPSFNFWFGSSAYLRGMKLMRVKHAGTWSIIPTALHVCRPISSPHSPLAASNVPPSTTLEGGPGETRIMRRFPKSSIIVYIARANFCTVLGRQFQDTVQQESLPGQKYSKDVGAKKLNMEAPPYP